MNSSQKEYAVTGLGGVPGTVPVVVPASLDAYGVPQAASATNPLPFGVTVQVNSLTYPTPPATYRCQVADALPVATATDVVVMSGSATKLVKIRKIQITLDATANGVIDFYIFKRATADTGGLSSAAAICKNDSLNDAPTASVLVYTTNPTINDAGVLVAGDHYTHSSAGSTAVPTFAWQEEFGGPDKQALTLRGIAEQVCIGFNGEAIPTGANLYCMIEWTEE